MLPDHSKTFHLVNIQKLIKLFQIFLVYYFMKISFMI